MPEKNILKTLEASLPPILFNILVDTGRIASTLGLKAYGVGGFVRDTLLGRKNLDVDIVVEGECYPVVDGLMERYGLMEVIRHERFLTAELYLDSYRIDIATTRKEEYPRASLPQVVPATLREDLSRRDFTINTLAVCLDPERFGTVVDLCGGLKDLEAGIIRVLHKESFTEDPVRIPRAVRFALRFGFRIEEATEALMVEAIEGGAPREASGRRMLDELVNIFEEERRWQIVERLFDAGLFNALVDGFDNPEGTLSILRKGEAILGWYEGIRKEEEVEQWFVYFLCLTDSLEGDALRKLSCWLDVGGKRRLLAIEKRDEAIGALEAIEKDPEDRVGIYEVFSSCPLELVLYIAARGSPVVEGAVRLYIEELMDVRPILTGRELKGLGLAEGPRMGEILRLVFREKLEGRLQTLEDELRFVKDLIEKG